MSTTASTTKTKQCGVTKSYESVKGITWKCINTDCDGEHHYMIATWKA